MEELEALRKKVVHKLWTLYMIDIFIFIIIIIRLGISAIEIAFFVAMFGYILSRIICRKDIKKFGDMYKQQIVIATFNSIFQDVKFDLNNGISYETISNTQMMNMGDRFHSNDYVVGKYKDINFEMSDIHIEEEYTDSDGDTHYTTVFKGQWYIFDFNKNFKANIQVCEKGFGNARRGNLFSKEKLKKVELEDIEFNKKFNVYSVLELDAFYVLTPNTMERIKQVDNKIKGSILLCFIDNKLHIGLYNGKDFFEPSIYKKTNPERDINKTKEEISVITNFVDILNLDNDLFKKNEGGV